MRTDCKISTRKQIRCRNASRLGYDKHKASVGDIIVYREYHTDGSYTTRIARMIGVIVAAPKIDPSDAIIKDWLLVLALSDAGHTCYERWVNPDWVQQIRNPPSKFAAWFFQEKLPYDVHTLRRLHDYGSLDDHYIDKAHERVEAWRAAEKDK